MDASINGMALILKLLSIGSLGMIATPAPVATDAAIYEELRRPF